MRTAVVFLLFAAPALAQVPEQIVQRELKTSQAYDTLAHLTDSIGPRLSGSKGAAAAVAWTTARFRAWGLPVANEHVMVPHWMRGREEGSLVSHMNQKIVLTALGGSVATPAAGVTADVIEAGSFDELKSLGAKVRGKIVYFNNPMDMDLVRAHRAFEAYSKAV